MFFRILLPLFLLSSAIFSQDFAISGLLTDQNTNSPIPYAAVCVHKTTIGVSTNTKGHFRLTIPKEYTDKMLHISSVGYFDTLVPVTLFNSGNKELQLVQKTYQIPEVTVAAKEIKKRKIVLNKIKKSIINQRFFHSSLNPLVLGRCYKYAPIYENFYIKALRFNFSRFEDGHLAPVFILRVMESDPETGMPKNDLIAKKVVEMGKRTSGENYIVSVSLEDKVIPFPRNGLFVGIEWIAIEENMIKTSRQTIVAPILKGKFGKSIDENLLWIFRGGEWYHEEKHESNANPYIEVILENHF